MTDVLTIPTTTVGISTGSTSPIVYTAINQITAFDGLDGQAAEIDITHFGSTAKEYVMGLNDNGSFNFEMLHSYADAGQDLLRTAKTNRAKHFFQVTFSDGYKIRFAGFVVSVTISAGGVDEVVTSSASVRITGDITEVP